jgi:hypothetical protein
MKQTQNLHTDARPALPLEGAITRWLSARGEYKKQASDENQNAYNATYYALGEAW